MAFLPKFRNNKFLDIALLLFIFLFLFVPRLISEPSEGLKIQGFQ